MDLDAANPNDWRNQLRSSGGKGLNTMEEVLAAEPKLDLPKEPKKKTKKSKKAAAADPPPSIASDNVDAEALEKLRSELLSKMDAELEEVLFFFFFPFFSFFSSLFFLFASFIHFPISST